MFSLLLLLLLLLLQRVSGHAWLHSVGHHGDPCSARGAETRLVGDSSRLAASTEKALLSHRTRTSTSTRSPKHSLGRIRFASRRSGKTISMITYDIIIIILYWHKCFHADGVIPPPLYHHHHHPNRGHDIGAARSKPRTG